MDWLEFAERMTSHLAWPIAAFFIARQFRDEIRQFIKRIRNAKYGSVELNLEQEIRQIKQSAQDAGITLSYPPSAFPADSIASIDAAPEWAFIKSWQEIESLLDLFFAKAFPSQAAASAPVSRKMEMLRGAGYIDERLASVVLALQQTRNRIVHESNHLVTRGEALEWLGISKSVGDRIRQRVAAAA